MQSAVPWPHELLPTEALVYTLVPTAPLQATPMSSNNTNDAAIPTSLSSASGEGGASAKKPFVVQRTLDEESGGRILAYHYTRAEGTGVTETKAGQRGVKNNSNLPVNANNQFAESFYRPPPEQRASKEAATVGFWDRVAEKLQWTTSNNVQLISLAWLLENEYTVRELLLAPCSVKMTDLVSAGIVCSLGDLLKLKFEPADLKRAPLLFNCKDLRTLFGATYRCVCGLRARPRPGQACQCTVLEDYGVKLNAAVLQEPYFPPQDLVALGYSLGETVDLGAISADLLQKLNYAPADLRALGLEKRHLRQLKISMDRAIRPRTERAGFGWSRDELNLFV